MDFGRQVVLTLVSEINAVWLKAFKGVDPPLFLVFSDRRGTIWWAFDHTQDLGMERGFFVIGIFIEMSGDWVWSFHSDIIKMFFPSYKKRASRFSDILFVALLASQNVHNVVCETVNVVWTLIDTADFCAGNRFCFSNFHTPCAV